MIFRSGKNHSTPEVVKIKTQKVPIRHVLTDEERDEYRKLLGSKYPHTVYFGKEYGLSNSDIEAEQDSDF